MPSDFESLQRSVQKLRNAVRISSAININRSSVRDEIKTVVQVYFRDVRPKTAQFFDGTVLADLDDHMQKLLALSNGRNAKTTYAKLLKTIEQSIGVAHVRLERQLSEVESGRLSKFELTTTETQIHETLLRMSLDSAASAYRQAIDDLREDRHSYRGPAVELRETLREVLDHMAPDSEVIKMPGYRTEADRKGPTMAQKAKYIMRQRQKPEAAAKPALDAADLIDTMTSRIARSTYASGSVSVHLSPSKAEVQQLKMHVDSVLAQLLGIFG
jgi:hypothetical protein